MQPANLLDSERSLFLGLILASDLLEITLPEAVMQKIQLDPVTKLYAAQARQQLFSEVDSPQGVFDGFLKRSMMDRSPNIVPRSGYFIWNFLRLAVTPNEWDQKVLPLPAALSFLYCLIRPIRLASKYGLIMLKRLLGLATQHSDRNSKNPPIEKSTGGLQRF